MKMFLSLVLIALSGPQQLSAQTFSISWFTHDSGGGTSTGGVFSVSGTIGQPDAGSPATNGPYALVGGFWEGTTTLQTPDAPFLSIERLPGGDVRLFWNLPATGFQLEQTSTLAGPPAGTVWSPVSQPHQTNANLITVTTPPSTGNRTFRLRKP